MRIAVAGASRGLGRQVVEAALAGGHEVVAIARTDTGLEARPGLRRYFFDIRDADKLSASLIGVDAVIWTVGIRPTRRPVEVFSQGTAALLRAMGARGVRRLIAVTGLGVGGSAGRRGVWFDRIVQPLLRAGEYADKTRQEAMIAASGLEWTIVRPGRLTDARARGRLRTLTELGAEKARPAARADVARLLLALAEEPLYYGNTVHAFY